jgi:hypothetical protein
LNFWSSFQDALACGFFPISRRWQQHICFGLKSGHRSIALGGLGLFLARPKAMSHGSQALCFFIESINFLIEPRHLGFKLISATQLFERFANRKFSRISHSNTSSGRC